MHGGDVGVGAGLQAVHEGRRSVVAPAPDAADVAAVAVHTVDGAGEGAALDGGNGVQSVADDAACIVAADVERCVDYAVLYQVVAVSEAHDSRRVLLGGGDGACHFQVLDGGAADVAEGGHAAVAVVGKRNGDGVAAAVKDAAEGPVAVFVRARAHRSRDADVIGQLHVLVDVAVAVVDVFDEGIPVVCAANLNLYDGEQAEFKAGADIEVSLRIINQVTVIPPVAQAEAEEIPVSTRPIYVC